MKTRRSFKAGIALLGICWASTLTGSQCLAAETAGDLPKTKIELQLTQDFYRALRAEGTKTYATDQSDEYLRQIAVSTRFMVETNLRLMQQQERIINLLEALQLQKAK
jgi:hypothetical protein